MSAIQVGALVIAGCDHRTGTKFHPRLTAWVLIGQIKKPEFTWPSCSLRGADQTSTTTISLRCRKIRQLTSRRTKAAKLALCVRRCKPVELVEPIGIEPTT